MTKAQIYFGNSLPKNLKLNSALIKDPEYQELRRAWDQETDPTLKEEKRQKALNYRAKVREELNLPDED